MKTEREARLKTEYAHLYPELKPRLWYKAAWLSARQFARIPSDGSAASIDAMLNEAHFEFRGGARRRRGKAEGRKSGR